MRIKQVAVVGLLIVSANFAVRQEVAHAETWEEWEDSLKSEDVVGLCDSIPAVLVGSNFPNIRVFADTIHDQTEPSITVNPLDPNVILIGTNTTRWKPGSETQGRQVNHEGSYFSSNFGGSWVYDTLPGSEEGPGRLGASDPAVAFDSYGNSFFGYVMARGPHGTFVNPGSESPVVWSSRVELSANHMEDKPHLIVGVNSASPTYRNYIHIAWTDLFTPEASDNNIRYSRSIDGGDNYSSPVNISGESEGEKAQGVNLAATPDGYVCAVWQAANGEGSTYLSFTKSSAPGGGDFPSTPTQPSLIEIHRLPNQLAPKQPRVNSFPVMAVDTSGGGTGVLYMAWADYRHGDADILLLRSRDGGGTWDYLDAPVRVNNDAQGNGLDQWMPWLTVGPDRSINVVFYDCRSDCNNLLTETWMARAPYRGDSTPVFTNFRVGEVSFEPCPVHGPDYIAGLSKYMGDYLGIATTPTHVIPCWNDNRYRTTSRTWAGYQIFVAPVPIIDTIGGVLADNAGIVGTDALSSTLVVGQDDTLTIYGGTVLTALNDSASIVVNGHMRIVGGGLRPEFSATGNWDGIRIESGGSVDWGHGIIIRNATTAITIEDGADSTMVLVGVRIENCLTDGVVTYENVSLRNDTIIGPFTGSALDAQFCEVTIDSCEFSMSGGPQAIRMLGCSGSLTSTSVTGSADYGLFLASDPEFPGNDTVLVTGSSVSGTYSLAHLYVGPRMACDIDSCELRASYAGTSNIGIDAHAYSWLRLRHSQIIDCDTALYSFESGADLGTESSPGGNSIFVDGCSGSCPGTYVIHECDLLLDFGEQGDGGEIDGGIPPPLPACQIKAEGNWWASTSPVTTWFAHVDYTPWLYDDPLGKRGVWPANGVGASSTSGVRTPLGNYPNPFNAGTEIEFTLSTAQHVNLRIYNILGQVVKSLADREFPEGTHRISWDATDDRGKRVATGVYLYRLVSGAEAQTKKMVLLK